MKTPASRAQYAWSGRRERRGRGRSGEVETDNLSDPGRAIVPIIVSGRLPVRERSEHVTLCVRRLRSALSAPAAREKRMTTYRIAGIDVHKKMLAVVVVDAAEEGEDAIQRRKFLTTAEGLDA